MLKFYKDYVSWKIVILTNHAVVELVELLIPPRGRVGIVTDPTPW